MTAPAPLRAPDVGRLLCGSEPPALESLVEACEDERPFRDALESMRSGPRCDALCDEARVLRLAPEPLLPEGKLPSSARLSRPVLRVCTAIIIRLKKK